MSWKRVTTILLMVTLATILGFAGGQEEKSKQAQGSHLVVVVPDMGSEYWLTPLTRTTEGFFAMTIYDSLLTRSNESGEIVAGKGGVAKSYEFSQDMKTLTFELFKGIPFHEGWGELTAEDVKYSVELIISEESRNDAAGAFRTDIASIEIINPYKIVFHLREPGWDILDRLTSEFQYLPIVSKKYVETKGREEAGRHPIGTGSFKFKEHVFGDHLTVDAVQKHWYMTPKLKSITWRKVPDAATRLAMLKTGEAQLTQIVYDQIAEVKQAKLQVKPMMGVTFMSVFYLGQYLHPKYAAEDTPPWAQGNWWEKDSPAYKVRKALSLAINRQAIVDHVLQGYATLEGAAVAPFFPNSMGHDPNKKVPPYDPKLALQLLREAGYQDPKDLVVLADLTPHSARPFNKPVMEAIVGMWEELGITVKTQTSTDYPSFQGKFADRSAHYAWAASAPKYHRGFAFLSLVAGEDSYLVQYSEAPELTRLIREGKAATTLEELTANSDALNDYLYENEVVSSICLTANLFAASTNLVWPNKPGQSGVIIHNYQYMYFEE